ncbi:class I SAM-dependent methyltransferase [Pseudonocardia sp. CA-142604]|uniref:class I SAM-dependent methyltransferase n=1 Tax=Pseudonocardia sp. CA-142604 TaxID=3240024 RepID=UPI003D8B48B8
MDASRWDQMYRTHGDLISEHPNATLITEARDLRPGHALDVGCGHGADARWMAQHGWDVTAIDLSGVALGRAAARTESGARVTWRQGDLLSIDLPHQAFDLVSAHYLPLPRREDHASLRRLLDAVAIGGTLLVVNHDLADLSPETRRAAEDHYLALDIIAFLRPEWTVEVHERRPRTSPAPAGTKHTHDIVLRVRRSR